MAKKPTATDPAPATFDVLMELHVCEADQESDRSDMTLSITIDKVTADGSVGFYGHMSKYPNSTADGVAKVQAIVMAAAKRLKELGIRSSWLGWFRRHFVATGLSWDDMMCVQQVGLGVLQEFGELGFEHVDAKEIAVPKAKKLRDE